MYGCGLWTVTTFHDAEVVADVERNYPSPINKLIKYTPFTVFYLHYSPRYLLYTAVSGGYRYQRAIVYYGTDMDVDNTVAAAIVFVYSIYI